MKQVVAISAAYGAGGTWIAPRLAEILGVPFSSNLVTPELADELMPDAEAATAEQSEGLAQRVLQSFARLPALMGATMPIPPETVEPNADLRRRLEADLDQTLSAGGLILGRGAVAYLSSRRDVLRVRLDGPLDRRIAQAMNLGGVTEEVARRHQSTTDRARTDYMRKYYNVDPNDSRLYHLVLDSTAFPLDASLRLLAAAADEFFNRPPARS